MTPDHLERYRQMARSIRFVPPLQKKQASQQALTGSKPPSLPLTTFKVSLESHVQPSITSTSSAIPCSDPIDPSEHAVQLIQSAVSQPTTLPPIYVLPESIGDRISRLIAPAPVKPAPVLFSPKIPQPGSIQVAETVAQPELAASAEVPQPQATDSAVTDPPVVESVLDLAVTDPAVTDPTIINSPVTDSLVTDSLVTDSIEPASHWLEAMTNYMAQVTQQLEQTHATTSHELVCPHCGSANFRKNGRRAGKQKYVCKECSRQFTGSAPVGFDRSSDQATAGSKAAKNSAKSATKQRNRGFGAQMKNR
ncbi:MAG: hypothetical protein Kow00121_25990 [Elainellaceae cyanobacterium]